MTFFDPNTLFDVGLMVYARPFAESTRQFLARLFSRDMARRFVDIVNDALLVPVIDFVFWRDDRRATRCAH